MAYTKNIIDIPDHRAIIETWKNSVALARELGVSPDRVRVWKMRNSIGIDLWPKLIELGRTGRPPRKWLTLDLLMRTRPSRSLSL